ncbi:hypothetical protein DICVIV_06703 [Dictyocaulus viviparus]|uniref:Uncharacterized protein n=1 Tax=Dictyocaulus viviparus TaxID=29172 RepID=A0A0D8XTQ8_DICVI|nr:hypothetical protein DICVIV_06703 [Dictyocaulus viviparus]
MRFIFLLLFITIRISYDTSSANTNEPHSLQRYRFRRCILSVYTIYPSYACPCLINYCNGCPGKCCCPKHEATSQPINFSTNTIAEERMSIISARRDINCLSVMVLSILYHFL